MDPRKRQKKLERRKAKAKAEKKSLAAHDPRDLAVRIERSATAPILHCCTSSVLWDQGISHVLVSRALPSGNVAFVSFLVDVYCLGVKDVMFDVVSRSRYDSQIFRKIHERFEPAHLEPADARKLIEGAVEYARQLGLPPHRDYQRAARIFGDIDPASSHQEFTYGKDGKPFFIAGPHDRPIRCRRIIDLLTARCGPDGFHYLIAAPGPAATLGDDSELLLDDDEEYE
jgi:hypothetical protein